MSATVILRVVRVVVLVVLFLLVVSMAMALGREETGLFEKVVLGGAICGLIVFANTVRRLRSAPSEQAAP